MAIDDSRTIIAPALPINGAIFPQSNNIPKMIGTANNVPALRARRNLLLSQRRLIVVTSTKVLLGGMPNA